ncbi:MAG: hypothetical protein WC775_00700 [Patescibacteria group bacterium]|jgi:hypothetical protein
MEYHEAPTYNSKTSAVITWFLVCLCAVVVVVVAVTVFKVKLNSLLYVGILLLCPLIHFVMMKSGSHKH